MIELERQNYALRKWAELEQEPKLSDCKKWFGFYRGIRFEINNVSFDDGVQNKWAHYIYISIDDQLPKEFKEKFWLTPKYVTFTPNGREYLTYDYYKSIIGDLDFHCRCTWYSKGCADERKRVVKIGCDYQHLYDDGKFYNVGSVYREVKETIDSLYNLVGKIKIRSTGDGKFRYLEEFE